MTRSDLGRAGRVAPGDEPVLLRVSSDDERRRAASRVAPPARPWVYRYRAALLTVDLGVILIALALGYELRFGSMAWHQTFYGYLGIAIVVGWLVALQYCGAYEVRHLAYGPEESKRVLRAGAYAVGILAVLCYATKTPVARGFVVGVIPIGTLLLLLERSAVRAFVKSRRDVDDWVHRIVAVGTVESVLHLLATTEKVKSAGLKIVGACVEDAPVGSDIAPGVPVLGGVLDTAEQAAAVDADVVAVTGTGLGPTGVRELGWKLEGTGRGLVMAPALTEIAGTRMHISPVEGLPLMWLDSPRLGRLPRLLKRTVDLVGASVLLLVALPLLCVTAAAIKLTSRGPVFFRQSRLGINGTEFTIAKFRSMYADAEHRRAEIFAANEQDGGGVLFKIREDPRVMPVGRWIRRFSIDELPQLVHVLSGTMSLVGPRPLASIDSTYGGSARRRLLVRPGLTGLWQISGRSELSWDDAVRLDLYYVENWSLGLDTSILVRTVLAVLTRKGAY